MKTLLIFRHAKSSWDQISAPDHDRPLNKRGKADAPAMGELLRTESLTPDLIICSTAKRAKDTAELAAEACGYEHDILFTRDLYGAEPESCIEVLNVYGDDEPIVMVVAHNPGLEDLVGILTKESVTLTTANIAQVELPIQSWRDLREHTKGKLLNLWRPKEL